MDERWHKAPMRPSPSPRPTGQRGGDEVLEGPREVLDAGQQLLAHLRDHLVHLRPKAAPGDKAQMVQRGPMVGRASISAEIDA